MRQLGVGQLIGQEVKGQVQVLLLSRLSLTNRDRFKETVAKDFPSVLYQVGTGGTVRYRTVPYHVDRDWVGLG